MTTIYVDLNKKTSLLNAIKVLKNFYKKNYFIKICKKNDFLSTNDVINTNFCYISLCQTQNKKRLIILSAIDNLIKGGAGQAVQNFNIKFGFPITTGIK